MFIRTFAQRIVTLCPVAGGTCYVDGLNGTATTTITKLLGLSLAKTGFAIQVRRDYTDIRMKDRNSTQLSGGAHR